MTKRWADVQCFGGRCPASFFSTPIIAMLLTVRREGGYGPVTGKIWLLAESAHTWDPERGEKTFLPSPSNCPSVRSLPPFSPSPMALWVPNPTLDTWPASSSSSGSGSGSVVQVHLVYSLVEMGAEKWVGEQEGRDEEKRRKQLAWSHLGGEHKNTPISELINGFGFLWAFSNTSSYCPNLVWAKFLEKGKSAPHPRQ